MAKRPVIVSGIQPTGNLHIGNYLGAVKNWVDLQNSGKYDCYFFIADLHSLTGNRSALERKAQILRTASELLAAGIDPHKSTFFVQSHVPQHTELGWIFNCVTPMAELERMTQFKDKSQSQNKNINVGLFTYPTLMAADILLYRANAVPVGQDQTQHAELTNDIVRWFNKNYDSYFSSVKSVFTETPKIMSLLEPMKKMSKSLGEGHVIELADEPGVIEKKLKKAVTATEGGTHSPGVDNLLGLLKIFGDKKAHTQFVKAEKDGSIRYGDLKSELGKSIGNHFADFRTRRDELMQGHDEVAEILTAGMERATIVAEKTMADVRQLVGIR
jgi:tryptophanyl-tRNA synthetase